MLSNKKTVIFYFSQSGNSLYAAKKIASSIGNTTLISIPEAVYNNQYKYAHYERIGFIMPLYFMGMPGLVKEFISQLEISKNSYCFSIVTQALTKGRVFYDIDKLLKGKSTQISYSKYITFPDSYIRWAEGPSEETIAKKIEQADKSLQLIADKIFHEENSTQKEGIILRGCSLVVYNLQNRRLKSIGKSFKVSNSCTSCGICERTCPARNIKLKKGKPVWSNKCEDCMACVQHCPKKAIYFNSRTVSKRRYINPNIQLKELLNKY